MKPVLNCAVLCWAGLGRIHVLILFPWREIISTVLISCYVGHFSLESKLEWKCWLQVRHLPTPPPPPQPPGWYKVSFTSIIAKFYWLVVKNTNFPKNCAVTVGWLETFGWRYARQAKLLEIDIVRLTWKLSCLSQCSAVQAGILTCCQDPLYFEEMLLLTWLTFLKI